MTDAGGHCWLAQQCPAGRSIRSKWRHGPTASSNTVGWHGLRLCEGRGLLTTRHFLRRLRACRPLHFGLTSGAARTLPCASERQSHTRIEPRDVACENHSAPSSLVPASPRHPKRSLVRIGGRGHDNSGVVTPGLCTANDTLPRRSRNGIRCSVANRWPEDLLPRRFRGGQGGR